MKLKNILTFLLLCSITGCKKGWLDAKPNQSLTVPNTIKDLQALLDNVNTFNIEHPSLGELGTDDYFLTDALFQTLPEREKNPYMWAGNQDDFYGTTEPGDWHLAYYAIFKANTVLDNVSKIQPSNEDYQGWANVKGSALFYRSYFFYNLAQIFCKPYSTASSATDLGIVLRLEPDVNILPGRATVSDTYKQIVDDLIESTKLLPVLSAPYKTRPSKTAAYAMLARVYLSMQDYDKAYMYSDSCLNNYGTLMNYNNYSTVEVNPFPVYNPEVIFHSRLPNHETLPTIQNDDSYVDTALYDLYVDNDLRKTLFFKDNGSGRIGFGGSYNGPSRLFNGLATDEIYLIKAECLARKANVNAALQVLNDLLITRWKTGTYIPIVIANPTDLLSRIITERRKELCFRAIRWTDIRRLNQDGNFAIELKRGTLNSTSMFTLPPNDKRYVYPIPNSEILYHNIPQNPR